ncbi:serine/threonine-protein kinase [Moorena bouillonii]|uniref:Protein kinase n=1 Tax=Moorena bouillonii PNG TaxID=568701 RepID=A0A1U7MXH8_9CYAN|nr:serine/threonine-protein kinase [Moorena bouillonii]OLT58389.1 protein kinase [Moorena bouillonii PNG]
MNLGLGQTIGGRYKIIRQLGQGGFGQTFVAEDQHLPGDNQCVVKQLKPVATDPLTLQTARRLFDTEAQILHQLGSHEQIPQLFAYFEENQDFYLVQELIEGEDLSQELVPGTQVNEDQIISLLQEILEVLEFVHQRRIIHRDINPQNILRRKSDGKLVLIDFGAVKQVSTQILEGGNTGFTVAIGTPGYRPSEQANGYPKLSSDIYAVGMIGIVGLTGLRPHQLPLDADTGEISWHNQISVSAELADTLDKMVCYDFRERYQSATLALQALTTAISNKTNNNSNPNTTKTGATLMLGIASSIQPLLPKPRRFRLKPYQVLLYTGVIGLGFAATVFMVNAFKEVTATDWYNQGETFLELKRYEQALDAYNRAVEIRGEYAPAWQGQGKTLFALKYYEEALNAYDQAIQIEPDYSAAWKGRGKTLEQLERYDAAIKAFNSALELQPNDLDAWISLGNVQVKSKNYYDAIASFDKALKLKPDSYQAWYRRGWALHNLRQYKAAVQSYDRALDYKPNSAEAWYQRGNDLSNLQKYKDAAKSYQQAVQFQPNFYQAWYSWGNTLNKLRKYQEALGSFEQAVKLQPNSYQAWYSRGWTLHQVQRYEDALEAYDKAIKLKSKPYQAWYSRGNTFYKLERYKDAIASYQQAVNYKPDYSQAWYSLGNALVKVNQYKKAIAAYDKAVRYQPNYRDAIKARDWANRALEAEIREQETGNREQETGNRE